MAQAHLASQQDGDASDGMPVIMRPGQHYGAPLPADEDNRLSELARLSILDTSPEQRFDDITQLICSIFDVPIALVSLVDKDRQWFKSCSGLACQQTDRQSSFCAWTLIPKNPEVLVVPDATEDVRYVQFQDVSSSASQHSTTLSTHHALLD